VATNRPSNPSDRRHERRSRIAVPVRVTVRGRLHMGLTVSLSTSGVRIKTDAPCLPRERVELQMLLQDSPLQAQAEVVRMTSVEVAFRFVSLGLHAFRTIAALTSAAPSEA
jgi:hypothetical protein